MSNILKISEAASLGMHAMALLAKEPGALISTGEIASILDVSEAHLSKVLQRLQRTGYVQSTRGPRGGFKFARPAESITVGDIVRSVEGSLSPIRCVKCESGLVIEKGDGKICEKAPTCATRKAWVDVTKRLVSLFDSITLADILKAGKDKGLLPV